MGWLKNIFKGKSTINKGLDMVSNGIDMAFYTDEEKAQANQKMLDFNIQFAKAIGPQSIARRRVACIVVGLWAYLVLLSVHLYLFGYATKAKYVKDVVVEMVNDPFMMIVAFFFLVHTIRGMTGKK